MKSIIFGAFVFMSIHYGWAHELAPVPLDPNVVTQDVGESPACLTCGNENLIPFAKTSAFDSPPCLKEAKSGPFKVFQVCEGGGADAGAFIYYKITSGPGHKYVMDTSGYDKRTRAIFFNSFDESLNGTFLTIHDSDKSVGASSQMGSDVFLLPRKTVPSIITDGNELIMTLQTGEQVVFDRATRLIKSGALKEGEFQITNPSTVSYTGSGISIRMDLRTYDDPRRKSINAVVSQNGVTCSVPRTKLFGVDGMPLTKSDDDFLKSIKAACPGKNFSL